MSQPVSLTQIDANEIVPGFHGKMIHTDSMTFAYWDVSAGAMLPAHQHPHEQVLNMLEGEFELTLDGVAHRLTAGDVLPIPGNVPHSGMAITDCRILDVFSPARDDYRS